MMRRNPRCRLALFVFAFALLPFAPAAADQALEAPLRLEVDLSERELALFVGDELIRSYPVAVGMRSHPTPRGGFTIDRLIWNPWWGPPDSEWARGKRPARPGDPNNPMQVVKIPFDPPYYYIHGTDRPESVGTAASHGCVRMRPEEAEELARMLMELTGEGREEAWYRTVVGGRHSVEVALGAPVELLVLD